MEPQCDGYLSLSCQAKTSGSFSIPSCELELTTLKAVRPFRPNDRSAAEAAP